MMKPSKIELAQQRLEAIHSLSDQREREIDAIVGDIIASNPFNLQSADVKQSDVYRLYDYHCVRREFIRPILQAHFKATFKRHAADEVEQPLIYFPGNVFNVARFDAIKAVYYKQIRALYHFDCLSADNYRKYFFNAEFFQADDSAATTVDKKRRSLPFQQLNDPLIMFMQMIDVRYRHLSVNPENWLEVSEDPTQLTQHIATWAYIKHCLQHYYPTVSSNPLKSMNWRRSQLKMQQRHLKNLDNLTHTFLQSWLHFSDKK